MICKVKGHTPKIDQTAFVHKSAVVTGDVVLGENVGDVYKRQALSISGR